MKSVLLTLMLFLVVPAFSQIKGGFDTSERVNANKPTLYLHYICQDEKKVYLRMYNNTIWHVYIEADKSYFPTKKPIKLQNSAKVYAIPSNEEIPVFYYIEKDGLENIKIPKIEYHYKNGGGWVSSEDSILFSVPTEYLRKGLKVYVNYSYEWEIRKNGNSTNEPDHRVYFRGCDIGSANTEIEPTPCK